MSKKTDGINPEKLAEFEKLKRGIVERRFNDARIFELYGLSAKNAAFAREYALTNNSFNASRVAGYAENTTRKNTARLVKRTARAVNDIKNELANIGVEFRAGLSEYLANGLIEIFEKRGKNPGAAVYAAREIRRIYIESQEPPGPPNIEKAKIDQEKNLDSILEECYKMGIYEK